MNLAEAHSRLHARVVAGFTHLAYGAIRNPKRTLWIAALVTLSAAPGLARLELRTDGHALVAPSAPEVRYDKVIRDRFGVEDQIVVLIRTSHPDGIFNPDTLQLVRQLSTGLAKIPGVNPANILSLATEPNFRKRPGDLAHQRLLDPALRTKAELNQLKEDLQRISLYTGTLVSFDGSATAVMVGTPAGADRTRLYEQVLACVAECSPGVDDVAVTGSPVAEALLGVHILEDLGVPKALLGVSTRSHTERARWTWPRNGYEFRRLIGQRIGLLPVAVVVMLGVFFLTFRNVAATLIPLPEVAAVLVFTFGLMGWVGVPVYLTIAVMPVLVTTMCVTDEIHLFSRYFAMLREHPDRDHLDLLREVMQEMASPVAATTLTTAVGFVSFAFSPLRPVQAFGVFTSVGVVFSLFFSLTAIPAMLALIDPNRLVSRKGGSLNTMNFLATAFGRLSLQVVRHRWWVLGLLVILTALTPLGLRRLVVQDSWVDGFAPESEFRRATQMVNDKFYGMHLLLVSFELQQVLRGELPVSAVTAEGIVLPPDLLEHASLIAGSPITISVFDTNAAGSRPVVVKSRIETVYGLGNQIGTRVPARDLPRDFQAAFSHAVRIEFEVAVHAQVRPAVVQQLADLAGFIRKHGQDKVGGVISPYDYLETTRFMARPDDPSARPLPLDPAEIKRMWDYYGLARGQQRLHQIVDTNYWQSLTTVFLKDANFVDTARLMAAIRAYERDRLAPAGIRLGFAGDVAVSQSLIKSIVTTQLQSLGWSLVGICAVTAVLGRSILRGLFCVLPSTLAVLASFAVMGWLNIPLGVASSMFAGMTLGIGVDFAIHMVEAYELARVGSGSALEALRKAMALTGPPVLINTLCLSLGFGVLLLSQVPANARLGLLLMLALVTCLIASVLILPVLLQWRRLAGPLPAGPDH